MRNIGVKQKGFTLIELMIVIAIVGILAAIALPAYQDYIVRSKMSEPLAVLAEAKTTVAEYVAANGNFPANPVAFGLNTTAPRSSDVMVALQVQPENAMASADVVYLVAEVYQSVWNGGPPTLGQVSFFQLSGSTNSDGTMSWDCIGGWDSSETDPVPNKYLPANCRG